MRLFSVMKVLGPLVVCELNGTRGPRKASAQAHDPAKSFHRFAAARLPGQQARANDREFPDRVDRSSARIANTQSPKRIKTALAIAAPFDTGSTDSGVATSEKCGSVKFE